MSVRAFLGDAALKAATLDRVRNRWEARQIMPLIYLKWSPEHGLASLTGTIAETADPQAFAPRTGIPLELALLCETLINAGITFVDDADAPLGVALEGDDRIWSFGTEWLEALDVEDDLSRAVPRFLPVFLTGIFSDDIPLVQHASREVRETAGDIVRLWERELRDEAVSRQEWRSVRARALSASEACTDPEGYPFAELVESLPWPLPGLAPEFPAICHSFLHGLLQALASEFLSGQDRAIWAEAARGARTLARARGEERFVGVSDEVILTHLPDVERAMFAITQPAVISRMTAAKNSARPHMTRMLRQQMDRILALLRSDS